MCLKNVVPFKRCPVYGRGSREPHGLALLGASGDSVAVADAGEVMNLGGRRQLVLKLPPNWCLESTAPPAVLAGTLVASRLGGGSSTTFAVIGT